MLKNFQPCDDKQLWRLTDMVAGKECSWPVYITAGTDAEGKCYLVQPAVHALDAEQYAFLSRRLEQYAYYKDKESASWLWRGANVVKAFKHCEGVTPEYYFSWPGRATGGTPTEVNEFRVIPPKHSPDDDFVKYLCSASGHGDIRALRLQWHLISHFALRWLVEERRPLKLDFCTLYAVPYRENWKSILLARYPHALKAFKLKPELRKGVLDSIGFNESLYSADLIEMPTNETFGWSLEVTPNKAFEEAITKSERESLTGAKTPDAYLYRWSRLISESYENILTLFGSFVRRAARPLGAVDQKLPKNLWRLLPRRSAGRVRAAPVAVPKTYYSSDIRPRDGIPGAAEPAGDEALCDLREVPDEVLKLEFVRPHRQVGKTGAGAADGQAVP